ENSHDPVKLFVPDGIVGMTVALNTGHGGSLPNFKGSSYPLQYRGHPEFLVVGTSFIVGHAVAVERGGDQLGFGGLRQQVSGQLGNGKLIEGHVGVESVDYPVAVFPDIPVKIFLIPLGVGVASKV